MPLESFEITGPIILGFIAATLLLDSVVLRFMAGTIRRRFEDSLRESGWTDDDLYRWQRSQA